MPITLGREEPNAPPLDRRPAAQDPRAPAGTCAGNFLEAFNHAWEEYASRYAGSSLDETAMRVAWVAWVAWVAVKRNYVKIGGRWLQRG
jgi:cation transport regulator ChaB